MRRLAWLAALCASACAERAPLAVSAPPAPSIAAIVPAPAPAPPRAEPGSPAPAETCDDELGSALARVSCDGSRVMVLYPIVLHPERAAPEEPSRGVLHAVSDLLQQSPEILFVRIEVYVGRDPGTDPEKRRVAVAQAQRRADALLQYLWRKRGVSAERLEAVGYGYDAHLAAPWPVVLRIVQRRRR